MNLGYTFKNAELLKTALSHSSYANETKSENNERLEFLGDSVLSIIVSDYLFHHFKNVDEGELTKLRASLVCEKSLAKFAEEINLNEAVLLGKGEKSAGGDHRPSILADAFEAVLAAIYLDGGINEAKKFVLQFLEGKEISGNFKDYKTTLQEVIQKNPEEELSYVLVGEEGPEHDKKFIVEVHLNSNVIGKGVGHSKKNAEQMAAAKALKLMGLKI